MVSRIASNAGNRTRRTQEERSAETREALIAAAISVIADVGYNSATTAMIAARASVSRGAIQYHFASKADLVVAIMETIARELNFKFDVATLSKLPVADRLEAMIEHYWGVFQGAMFRAGLSIWVALSGDPTLAKRVEASLKTMREGIWAIWYKLFDDTPATSEQLAAVLHIVMAAMRGAAIAFIGGRSSTNFRDERRLLRDMALAALSGTGGR